MGWPYEGSLLTANSRKNDDLSIGIKTGTQWASNSRGAAE